MERNEIISAIEDLRNGNGGVIIVLVDGEGITSNGQMVTIDDIMNMDEASEFVCLHTIMVTWPAVEESESVSILKRRYAMAKFIAVDDIRTAETFLKLRGLLK